MCRLERNKLRHFLVLVLHPLQPPRYPGLRRHHILLLLVFSKLSSIIIPHKIYQRPSYLNQHYYCMKSLPQLNRLGGKHLLNNPQVKMPSTQSYNPRTSGALSMPIHTMPDTRERWQRQTWKGTAVRGDVLGPRLPGTLHAGGPIP